MKRLAIVALLLAAALTVGGCGGPSAADQKATCFDNERLVQTEMKLFNADSGLNAPLQDVLDKTHVSCPSGGKYSYDPATGIVSCSIHGHP